MPIYCFHNTVPRYDMDSQHFACHQQMLLHGYPEERAFILKRQSRKQSQRYLPGYLPLQIVVFPWEIVVGMCKLYPAQDVNMCRQSLPENKKNINALWMQKLQSDTEL